MVFIELLLFLIVSFLVLYLPGRFITRKLGYSEKSFIITASVSLGVGIAFFLFFTYLLAWIQLSFVYSLVLLPIILFEGKKSFTEIQKKLSVKNILSLESILIYVGTVAMTYLTWRSGSIENGKLVFFGIHAVDSIYHQSLISNLMHSFPPTHPGIAGVPLRGYNFFYDFLTVQFATQYFFDRFDLFFRFIPLLTSFFYGIAGLSLTRFFSFNRLATLTTLYLLYFAQNFSFFFRLIPDNFAANFNFEIIQSLGNIHDPSVVFSSILVFLVTITLFKTKKLQHIIIPAVLLGIIPTMKIHTGVIAFAPVGLIALYALVFQKNVRYFFILCVSGIIAAITYLPINFGAGYLIFSPFHLYRHYMDSSPMFKNKQWSLQYDIFQQHSNFLRMGYINIIAMLAYLIPNLGVRLFSLFLVPRFFKKSYWSYPKVYFALAIIFSFLVPTFFIQSVYAFVIIQCLWVASILLVYPTASVLSGFVNGKNRWLIGCYILILFVLTFPATISELYHHSREPYEVNDGLYSVSKTIPESVKKDETIFVVNRIDSHIQYAVPLVSALTGRSVFSEPEVLEFAGTANEIERRTKIVDKVSTLIYSCAKPQADSLYEILESTGSDYLLLLAYSKCINSFEKLRLHTSNENVALYKYIH